MFLIIFYPLRQRVICESAADIWKVLQYPWNEQYDFKLIVYREGEGLTQFVINLRFPSQPCNFRDDKTAAYYL